MLAAEQELEKDVDVEEQALLLFCSSSSSKTLRVGIEGGLLLLLLVEEARVWRWSLESLERPRRGGMLMLRSVSLGLLDQRDNPEEREVFAVVGETGACWCCSRTLRRGDGRARLDE